VFACRFNSYFQKLATKHLHIYIKYQSVPVVHTELSLIVTVRGFTTRYRDGCVEL